MQNYTYVFYLTHLVLNKIEKYFISLFLKAIKSLHVSPKRLKAVEKQQINNVYHAFNLMLLSLAFILLSVFILFAIETEIPSYIVFLPFLISLGFNYFNLWQKDKYKKYFNLFKTKEIPLSHLVSALIYHTSSFFILMIIIYLKSK